MFLVEQIKGKLDNMKFSNIKKIRKEFNLTQKEIASILNVDRTTYTGWETGKNTIPLAKLLDFQITLNIVLIIF